MTAVLLAASARISGCWTVGFEARDAVVAGEIEATGADRLTLSDIGSEQVSVTGSPDTTAIRGEAAIRVLSTSDGDPTLDLVDQSGVVTPRLRVDGGDLETVSVERFTFDTPSAMDLNYTAACARLDVDGLAGAVQVYTTGCRVDLDTTSRSTPRSARPGSTCTSTPRLEPRWSTGCSTSDATTPDRPPLTGHL